MLFAAGRQRHSIYNLQTPIKQWRGNYSANMERRTSATLWKLFILLSVSSMAVKGSRILFFVGMGSKSHRGMFDPLSEELGKRGHEIVFVSMYPSEKNVTNVREIGHFVDILQGVGSTFNPDKSAMMMQMLRIMSTRLPNMTKELMLSEELKELYEPGQKFDLIVMNAMFSEYALGFTHLYDAPVIYMSTPVALLPWVGKFMGNPVNLAYEPNLLLGYTPRMTFTERLLNVISTFPLELFRTFVMLPLITSVSEDVFGKDVPHLHELEKNVSLVFLNSHVSVGHPKPMLPNMVEVGGMHCRPAKPLPKDLAEFADGSGDNGFIYFSFGSVVKPSDMPEDMRKDLVKVFSELPLRVIWKWHEEEMEGLPPNVKLGKWLPQQDILGHPKIRAFITHGGLFSSYEAIYHGVPLIGVPFFGDQEFNMNDAVRRGYALKISLDELNGDSLKTAINEILSNKKYHETVKERSTLLRDQQTKPLDRAVYWTEYVLRHRGAPHLRSAAADLSWIQFNLIDVYASILTGLILVSLIMYFTIRFSCRLICCCKSNKKVKIN